MRGFTLIEMLVVVVIIGILTTTVAMTLTDNPRQNARHEAQRLASLLETANREAHAGQRLLAWSAHDQGYDFFIAESDMDRRAETHWQALTDDPLFRPRTLENGVKLGTVKVDEQPLSPGALLVFQRNDPPLFRIRLMIDAKTGSDTRTHGAFIELRGLPTGQVVVDDEVINDADHSDRPAPSNHSNYSARTP